MSFIDSFAKIHCSLTKLLYASGNGSGGRRIEADFSGGVLTSNGGALLLGLVDCPVRLLRWLAVSEAHATAFPVPNRSWMRQRGRGPRSAVEDGNGTAPETTVPVPATPVRRRPSDPPRGDSTDFHPFTSHSWVR